MKTEWLIKDNHDDLLIFFAGWGMDAEPFRNIGTGRFDVIICYDYHDINLPSDLTEACPHYESVWLLAWSFGVCVAAHSCSDLKTDKAIALNGTLHTAHDDYGIPLDLFDKTIEALDEENLMKFYRRMCRNLYKPFLSHQPKRDLRDLDEELRKLRAMPPAAKNIFDHAVVTQTDSIIPQDNQLEFWKTQSVSVTQIEGNHFPFYLYNNWEDILNA
ncbi:hypothetical protein BVX97_02315 [bacterium E08(2017)]|nr:hypothetical protein BVX97_02315 [bacterium E08(2017)]